MAFSDKMKHKKIFLLLFSSLFFVTLVWSQGSGKFLTLQNLNGVPDVIRAEEYYLLHFDLLNTGSMALSSGEVVAIKMRVNEDNPSVIGNHILSTPLNPGETLGIDFPAYLFEGSRFSGGIGNDIVIWPTIVGDPIALDSLTKSVIYIDGAAFRVNNNLVGGINHSISYQASYIVSVKTENVGIEENLNSIQFYTQLDNLPPQLIGVLDQNLLVGEIGETNVESFSVKDLYPNFVYDQLEHTLTIWAKESNKENTVDVATYTLTSSPLPVELMNFHATNIPSENKIMIEWETAYENNNKDFIIQKYNFEKQAYEVLGKVPSAGNGGQLRSYGINDEAPNVGLNRYRVAQLDYDGTLRALSTTFTDYQIPQSFIFKGVYPNPSTETLYFELFIASQEAVYIHISDIEGKEIYNGILSDQSGTVISSISVKDMEEGVYFYRIYNPVLSFYGRFLR